MHCPYCRDGDASKMMRERFGGAWFKCNRCGHIVISGDNERIVFRGRSAERLHWSADLRFFDGNLPRVLVLAYRHAESSQRAHR